eukprot:TRINITY_DN30084_c0_g1_i1.p2 TRINITY_DN30084_c0_g1~~TRINITY_DN30084_c0_g1_i1.p2  ORF type:complete len:247 (+),score=131.98 TRINITY_DN30084_c0_g1_i1:47-787(+)
MSRGQYDISVFSSEGQLWQVEYTFKTLAHEKLTNVGLKGQDCAVVVCQKKVPDKLIKVDSVSHVFFITKEIGMALVGRPADGAQIVDEARYEAGEFWFKNGYECDASWLAKRLGEKAQVYTQQAGYRPLGAAYILFSMENQDNADVEPKIYAIDPAGLVVGYKATAQGQKDNEVKLNLEKTYKPDMSLDETIMCGILALQKSLGNVDSNLTAADLEIAIATKDNPKVRFVDKDAVEEYITKIVERD